MNVLKVGTVYELYFTSQDAEKIEKVNNSHSHSCSPGITNGTSFRRALMFLDGIDNAEYLYSKNRLKGIRFQIASVMDVNQTWEDISELIEKYRHGEMF